MKSDPSRVVTGIDPRLNQTALSLLSLVDDAPLREEISRMLMATQARLASERVQSAESRTMAALHDAFEHPDRDAVSLHDLAVQVNASADDFDDQLSPRLVGRIHRARSIPLHKSHGTIVVPRPER